MRSPILLLALTAALWAACSTSPGPAAPEPEPAKYKGLQEDAARFYDHAWARDPIWDDGQAEVALYDARRPQYGQLESYQAVFIVVKDDFRRPLYVKADPPLEGKDLFPVLKLNAVHSYLTPRYPYHFLATVFVQRDDPTALVKFTLGSQEWCGNTFKEITTWGPQPQLVAHSYFDGEGDGTHPLDLRPGDLLEDQLPLALRSLEFQPHLSFERRMLPSLISNKLGGPPRFVKASFAVVGEEAVETSIGRQAAWKVEVRWGDVRQSWWFEKSASRLLLKMESSDGRAWLLRSRTRKPYWKEPTFRPEM